MSLKLFFDMDGVLDNFNKSAQSLNIDMTPNVPSDKLSAKEKIVRNAFWNEVAKHGKEFWTNIEPFEEACEMVHFYKDRTNCSLNILSKAPTNKSVYQYAYDGKLEWLKNHFGDNFFDSINIIKGKKEEYCTGKNCVLIDDRKDLCEDWVNAGGIAIYHQDIVSTIEQLNEIIFKYEEWK